MIGQNVAVGQSRESDWKIQSGMRALIGRLVGLSDDEADASRQLAHFAARVAQESAARGPSRVPREGRVGPRLASVHKPYCYGQFDVRPDRLVSRCNFASVR